MTFKEKVTMEHPDQLGEYEGGVKGCPHVYGYEPYSYCEPVNSDCETCWDREIIENGRRTNMTRIEKLREMYPENSEIDTGFNAGQTCPSEYGLPEDCADAKGNCYECWNREMPASESNENATDTLTEKEKCQLDDFANDLRKLSEEVANSSRPLIKDSGERRQFETGAVRDMQAGKGDMVSLPPAAILRLSKHYENGAIKYGRWNYTKGIPVSSFIDSAFRHLFKYLDGWDDEDHLSAAAFNILGAMEMEAHHKELNDLPSRGGKKCFNYVEE